jgi:hypothetical protein
MWVMQAHHIDTDTPQKQSGLVRGFIERATRVIKIDGEDSNLSFSCCASWN